MCVWESWCHTPALGRWTPNAVMKTLMTTMMKMQPVVMFSKTFSLRCFCSSFRFHFTAISNDKHTEQSRVTHINTVLILYPQHGLTHTHKISIHFFVCYNCVLCFAKMCMVLQIWCVLLLFEWKLLQESVCVELVCSLWVDVGFLWVSPTVQRHTGQVNRRL